MECVGDRVRLRLWVGVNASSAHRRPCARAGGYVRQHGAAGSFAGGTQTGGPKRGLDPSLCHLSTISPREHTTTGAYISCAACDGRLCVNHQWTRHSCTAAALLCVLAAADAPRCGFQNRHQQNQPRVGASRTSGTSISGTNAANARRGRGPRAVGTCTAAFSDAITVYPELRRNHANATRRGKLKHHAMGAHSGRHASRHANHAGSHTARARPW